MRAILMIRLADDADMWRIQNEVPHLVNLVQSETDSNLLLVRSKDGLLFAWLVSVSRPLGVIRAAIHKSLYFQNNDALFICEIGRDHEAEGFIRQVTWLQRTAQGEG